jgi:hypothetical protein
LRPTSGSDDTAVLDLDLDVLRMRPGGPCGSEDARSGGALLRPLLAEHRPDRAALDRVAEAREVLLLVLEPRRKLALRPAVARVTGADPGVIRQAQAPR